MINQIKYNLAYGIIRTLLESGYISYREFELIDAKNKASFNIQPIYDGLGFSLPHILVSLYPSYPLVQKSETALSFFF